MLVTSDKIKHKMEISRYYPISVIAILFLITLSCINNKVNNDNTGEEVLNKTNEELNANQGNLIDLIPLNQSLSKKEIEEIRSNIERLQVLGKLKKYSYPDMSYCGGVLYGYYDDKELVFLFSKFEVELGYVSKKVWFYQGEVVQIEELNYSPVWEKYTETVGNSKMIYTDTTLVINLGNKVAFRKKWNNDEKIIASNENTLNKLVDCISRMKKELDEKKILVND